MTLSITTLRMTIRNTQHINTQRNAMLSVIYGVSFMLSVRMLSVIFAECGYTERRLC